MFNNKGATPACMLITRICGLLSLLLLSTFLNAAEIEVWPDRNPIGVGEEFTLTFSTTEQPDGNPDFSPLRNHFEMVGTSTSSNIRMINGKVSSEIAWQVRLYPKSTGTLAIPPIAFGSQSSPAAQITVDESVDNGIPRDGVLVELETENNSPYVQQQVIITQRMLHSVELMRNGASMSHPEVGEGKALIQQLGGVTNRTINRKGIRYKVSERRYAVFPQTSGKLTFRPTVFQGVISTSGSRSRQPRDPFGMMSGRQIRRFSEPLTLEVKAQPSGTKGTWLPAKSLSLNTHWQVPVKEFKVGEPVTLTIAVIADGLMAEQLPEVKLTLPKGIKGYSNQPELRNNHQGDSLIGARQERWILIGTAPGEYTLPAISLKWWNLQTGKTETAFVPPETIIVSGGTTETTKGNTAAGDNADEQSMESTPAPSATESEPAAENKVETAESELETESGLVASEASQESLAWSLGWWWLLAPGILLLIVAGLLYRRKRNKAADDGLHRKTRQTTNTTLLQTDYYQQLEQACHNNEAQMAHDALSDWVRHDLRLTPATVATLRQQATMELKQALDELSMVLYAQQTAEWRGDRLWQAVQHFVRQQQDRQGKQKTEGDLLNLYPE